jgi:2-keto-4-pentenoate hydratase
MAETANDTLVDQLQRAWESRRPVEPDSAPSTLVEAYEVQAAFVARNGPTCGYKVGMTNEAIQQNFGIDAPVTGRLWANRVFANEATVRVPGELGLIAEPEFAYRMGADLPAADAPFSADQVAAAIESIMPALEIVESRLSGALASNVAMIVADNVMNSAWVGGTPIEDWSPESLPGLEVIASINGEEVSRGNGAAVLGDPLRVMIWLANELAGRGESLRAGDVVTTGCCTDVLRPGPNDEVTADFGPLGTVSVRFARGAD